MGLVGEGGPVLPVSVSSAQHSLRNDDDDDHLPGQIWLMNPTAASMANRFGQG
jgi:hypothetical protein